MTFNPDTVYGSRSGYHEILLVTSQEKGNPIVKSKLYKTGSVHGPSMLQRQDMLKLPRDGYGTEARFTQVQELKQAKVAKPNQSCAFTPPSRNYCKVLF